MPYRKFRNVIALLLFAFCAATAWAAQGQHESHRDFKEGKYFHCAKGETKEACLFRFESRKRKHSRCANNETKEECVRMQKNGSANGVPEQRKHIRRVIIQREEYKFYGRHKDRSYQHPVTSPNAGTMRAGKGRLSAEQREDLRRMINEVNQDRRYRRSD